MFSMIVKIYLCVIALWLRYGATGALGAYRQLVGVS